jgi:membrane protein implicated in regulation of membrane protease activity
MALFEFGLSCIALVVVIVIIAIIFIFVLEFVVEFLPALIVAGVVYWYTDGDVLWTIVAFVVSAIVFAGLGQTRRRRVRD